MRRDLYGPDHEAFREVVKAYVKREVIPNQQRCEQERNVGRQAQRTAFGKPLAAFQNTAFELASAVTEVDVLEAYLDKAVLALNSGELTAVDAAKAKLWATEVQHRVLDRCLQLFGGYGYMSEYPIARAYADARVQTIYGGTSEIMRTIIARDLTGLRT